MVLSGQVFEEGVTMGEEMMQAATVEELSVDRLCAPGDAGRPT
jgi:hypothetical protein